MQQPDSVALVQGFIEATNRHEMEDIMQYLTDSATVTIRPPLPDTNITTHKGKEQIHKLFAGLFATHTTIVARNLQASGNEVSWEGTVSDDHLSAIGADPAQVSGRAVVEDAQISSFMVEYSPESVARIRQAMAAGQPA